MRPGCRGDFCTLMPPADEQSNLPTLSTEKWLEQIKKLEDAHREAADDRDRYRTLLRGTWALIGFVVALIGAGRSIGPHAGIVDYAITIVGVVIAWRAFAMFK
jgi:hypothetical protein